MLGTALFIAVGLDRPVQALTRRGMRRTHAALTVVAIVVVALVAAVAVALPALVGQVSTFLEHVPGYVDDLLDRVSAMSDQERAKLKAQLTTLATPARLADVAGGLLGGAVSVLGGVIIAGTTAMLAMCLLVALDRVRAGALRLVVASRRARVAALTEAVEERVGGYLVGAVGIALVAGTCAFAWCTLTGVPYPALMAVIVAFFDLIPQVGATIGSTIVSLVAFTQSFGLALATIGFFCVYQAVENWLVYPRVMSRAVKVSYLAAIVCALVGGALMGVLGVLVAVPAWASIQMLVREVVIPQQDRR
ncbi:AI-2E family transporter [Luedemannella flava]